MVLQASELIPETLVQIVEGEPKEKVAGIRRNTSPLVLGLSVFRVTRFCKVDLGVKGWAELCVLISSKSAMDNKNLEELSASIDNPQ